MRKIHMVITAYLTVLTIWSICSGYFKIGLPLLLITYMMTASGMAISLKRFLSLW